MPSGYIGSQPDIGWWLEQIQVAKDYRKKYAWESEWSRWRDYYRGVYRRKGVQPINVFFMYVRSLVPRIYFRNPTVSVSPAMPGFINMAFAQVLNRLDNKLLVSMDVKSTIKGIVQDGVMFGTGCGKLGYGALFNVSGFDDDAPLVKKRGEKVEYDRRVTPFSPWYKRIAPKFFLVQAGVRDADESRFFIHEVQRDPQDIKDDPRFKTQGLEVNADVAPEVDNTFEWAHRRGLVTLYEIYDRKTDKVFVIGPNVTHGKSGAGRVMIEPTSIDFDRPPLFTITFNPDDQVFWGVPDSKLLEPHQLEINEINTQIMKHRRLTIIKLIASETGITEEEAEKMVSEDVSAVVRTKTRNPASAIQPIQASDIPVSLIRAKDLVMEIIRETMGFSRNTAGEYMGGSEKPTAEEAATVRQAVEIRVDERRDEVADMLVDIVSTMNDLIFRRWTADQVVDVVGPGGAKVWVQVNPASLRMGKYTVKIDPDSSVPMTQAQRESRAASVYQLLKDNPLIDPVKLTQMLIGELGGVQLDDLMRALPSPEQAPEGPMRPEQLAGLMRRQVGEAQRNPNQLLAQLTARAGAAA